MNGFCFMGCCYWVYCRYWVRCIERVFLRNFKRTDNWKPTQSDQQSNNNNRPRIKHKWYGLKKTMEPTSGEISLAEGADNCVAGLKKLAVHAEKKGVTICIEHLNSRDGSHPMKGHPGYQGDDVDYVANIVRRVGSPRVKMLFDIYHVQIMNGDVIRRLEECKDVIGHIHTAGNPGRAELDDNQEINFPPILRKIVEIGYKGFVGHEFIPTRDPLAGLKQAIQLCDV